MLATVPNMGTRNTDMGKKRVLFSRMSILSGKTHTNQAQQNSVVSMLGKYTTQTWGTTDSAGWSEDQEGHREERTLVLYFAG